MLTFWTLSAQRFLFFKPGWVYFFSALFQYLSKLVKPLLFGTYEKHWPNLYDSSYGHQVRSLEMHFIHSAVEEVLDVVWEETKIIKQK